MFVAITNTPRDYAWGSTTAIAELLAASPRRARPRRSCGWARTRGRPRRSSDAASVGTPTSQRGSRPTRRALGPALAAHGARLPFLLKVLAAAEPAVAAGAPDARAGACRVRARERRRHPARRVRPQLQGRVPQARADLRAERHVRRAVAGSARSTRSPASSRCSARRMPRMPRPSPGRSTCSPRTLDTRRTRCATRSSGCSAMGEAATRRGRVGDRARHGARGIRCGPAVAVRAVVRDGRRARRGLPGRPGHRDLAAAQPRALRRGEALYLPAGNIHAYLAGLGIELMAASDNVLRGGLTPKHIDVTELLDVLDFTPDRSAATRARDRGARRARVPARRARLRAVPASSRRPRRRGRLVDDAARVPLDGPAIVLAEGGDLRLTRRARRDVRGARRRGVRHARRGRRSTVARRRDRLDRDDRPARGIREPDRRRGVPAPSTRQLAAREPEQCAGTAVGVVCSTFTKWCRMTAAVPKPVSRAICSRPSVGLLEQLLRAQEALAVEPGGGRRAQSRRGTAGRRCAATSAPCGRAGRP